MGGGDIVPAHGDQEGRITDDRHLGALVGRHAGRIRAGSFELDGGVTSRVQRHWRAPARWPRRLRRPRMGRSGRRRAPPRSRPALEDGEENYPGRLSVKARFEIVGEDALRLTLDATTTRPTLCNLTWHPYFNLAGHAGGHVGRHRVTIDADHYLPLGSDMCPTGKIAIVDDTPFDLRSSSRLGTGMVAEHPQIRLVEGYDHYFPINGEGLRRAVRLEAPDDRIAMEVWTTQAGVPFYTANTPSAALRQTGQDIQPLRCCVRRTAGLSGRVQPPRISRQ